MSCSQFVQYVKEKCGQCFGITKESKNSSLDEHFIQMQEPKAIQSQNQSTVPKQIPQIKVEQAKQKEAQNIKLQPRSPILEDEFHSIQQIMRGSGKNNIRGTKKIGRLDILQRSSTQTKQKEKPKTQPYTSGQWEDTPVAENLNIEDQLLKVKDWFKKQYGKVKIASFRVNHAVRLRMQGNGMLTLLSHKLQDFKIKFIGENLASLSPGLQNKSKTLAFKYLKEQTGQASFKRSKLFSYYQIKTYAPSLQQLIRALVSKEAMRILHSFELIQPVEYEGRNLRIPFPILKAHQKVSKFKNDRIFHLASQMGESDEIRSQQQQIVFVIYNLDENEESWQCIIRIDFGFLSIVQIYSESCEDQKKSQQSYLQQKFASLNKYLSQLKIVPAN